MKIHSTPFLALAFTGCLLTAGLSSASPASAATSTSKDRTISGTFTSSDGNKGTYVETYTVVGAVATDTIVYTSTTLSETSTETLTTTTNTDGTKTVVFSKLGFGATVAFTSTITYITSTGGNAVGTGTFVAVDGTVGTVTAVLAKNGQTSITSIDFTSALGVLTREVRLEENSNGCDTDKILDVDASGVLTVTTIARLGGMHHHH